MERRIMLKHKALGYKDIGLVSRHASEIEHRSDADTGLRFCGYKLSLPIIASPMPDVASPELLNKLIDMGGFGFTHRFQSIDKQVLDFRATEQSVCHPESVAIAGSAIGVTGDYYERFCELHDNGCNVFCLDTANGANIQVQKAIEKINDSGFIYIVAGNVATKETFKYLTEIGTDGIRVGIAGGSVCTTKTETGIYRPMISTITECYNAYATPEIPSLIADGGIKEPSDMCKAIAVGADCVMLGSILGQCEESPAKVVKLDGKLYKVFRGAASYSTQIDTNGKPPKYVEGEERLLPYAGPLEKTVQRFQNGLRSSMSYMNAKNLNEYRQNSDWCIL
jgi:IMP dehydrogenase/GMP reductase